MGVAETNSHLFYTLLNQEGFCEKGLWTFHDDKYIICDHQN